MSPTRVSPSDNEWRGRHRLLTIFNKADQGFTNAFRLTDFDGLLARLTLLPNATLKGWYQFITETTALYQVNDALVLLERLSDSDGDPYYVGCVGAATWEAVSDVVAILLENEPSLPQIESELNGPFHA